MIKLTELGEDHEYSVWDGDVEVEAHLTYTQASTIDDYIRMLRDQLNGKFSEAMTKVESITENAAKDLADVLKLRAENEMLRADADRVGDALKKQSKIFYMIRNGDESGVSGIGHVLTGIVFPSGDVAVSWHSDKIKISSVAIYRSFEEFKTIHIDSHPTNNTEIVWK